MLFALWPKHATGCIWPTRSDCINTFSRLPVTLEPPPWRRQRSNQRRRRRRRRWGSGWWRWRAGWSWLRSRRPSAKDDQAATLTSSESCSTYCLPSFPSPPKNSSHISAQISARNPRDIILKPSPLLRRRPLFLSIILLLKLIFQHRQFLTKTILQELQNTWNISAWQARYWRLTQ